MVSHSFALSASDVSSQHRAVSVVVFVRPSVLWGSSLCRGITGCHSHQAKTDPERGLEFGNPDRPETDNLLGLYAILSGKGRDAAAQECAEMGWGQFKPLLAEAAVAALEPIQTRHRELMADRMELDRVLEKGRDQAESVATETLERVRNALGFAKRS